MPVHKGSGDMKRYIRTAAAALLTIVLAAAAVIFSVVQWSGPNGGTVAEQSSIADMETSGAAEQDRDGGSEAEAAPGDADAAEAEDEAGASGAEQGTNGGQMIYATVLGDSIAKGYSGEGEADLVPYGSLAMDEIAGREACEYEIENFAKNGLDSAGMNEKILTREEVRDSLGKSDVIFITVGSNDLLNECKRVVQEILNTDTKFKSANEALQVLEDSVKDNPFLVLKIIGALGNWDYHSFEANWIEMMDTVKELKQEETRIIVTNIYNPVANLKLPSTMNQVVEDIIGNMNRIIDDHAGEYGYGVADAFHSNVSAYVQSDGLHPNQDGQQIIAELVFEEYESAEEEE